MSNFLLSKVVLLLKSNVYVIVHLGNFTPRPCLVTGTGVTKE